MNYVRFYEAPSEPGGLGAATGGRVDLLRDADRMLTPLPGPLVAAIDKAPMPRKQKALVKQRPTMFFVAMAETARWLLVKFIKNVQARSGKSPVYRVGGVTVRIDPARERDPILLAVQFLTVTNRNPVTALQVAGQMGGEIAAALTASAIAAGQKAYIEPALAAGRAGSRAVQKATTDAARAADQAAKAAQKAAEDAARAAGKATSDVKRAGDKAAKDAAGAVLSIFGLNGLGCPDCGGRCVAQTLGDSGASAAAAGAGAAGALETVKDLLGLVATAIALAEPLVPMLMAVAKGAAPRPPSPQTMAKASADASKVDASADAAGVSLTPTIFGLPAPAVLGGGALVAVGGLVYALTRKRRRR